jgi:hypothetical protein
MMPRSKREWSFALVRTVIIVALVGAAAWFLAIAYAPQRFAPRSPLQELNCPLMTVTDREAVVLPQACSMSAQAKIPDNDGHVLVKKTGQRPPNAKQQEPRIRVKKQPAYAPAGNALSPERSLSGEPAKRGAFRTNQKQPKSSSSSTTLAQSTPYPSPFGDLHGQ